MDIGVNTKEKLFSCDVCSSSVSQKAPLVKHIIVHTKEEPHSYEICSKTLNQRSHSNTHKKGIVMHELANSHKKFFSKAQESSY